MTSLTKHRLAHGKTLMVDERMKWKRVESVK